VGESSTEGELTALRTVGLKWGGGETPHVESEKKRNHLSIKREEKCAWVQVGGIKEKKNRLAILQLRGGSIIKIVRSEALIRGPMDADKGLGEGDLCTPGASEGEKRRGRKR